MTEEHPSALAAMRALRDEIRARLDVRRLMICQAPTTSRNAGREISVRHTAIVFGR